MCKADRLSTVLVRCNLCNNLHADITRGRESMGLFDLHTTNDCFLLEHVFKINQTAVVHMLSEVVLVMHMNNALSIRLHNVLRQKISFGQIFRDVSGHIVSLNTVDDRIFVAVFLKRFFVCLIDQRQNLSICAVSFTDFLSIIAITNIISSYGRIAVFHQRIFDHILNFFDMGRSTKQCALIPYTVRNLGNIIERYSVFARPSNCSGDLCCVELDFSSVSFDDFHLKYPSRIFVTRPPVISYKVALLTWSFQLFGASFSRISKSTFSVLLHSLSVSIIWT